VAQQKIFGDHQISELTNNTKREKKTQNGQNFISSALELNTNADASLTVERSK
jgi:hypothetical protein